MFIEFPKGADPVALVAAAQRAFAVALAMLGLDADKKPTGGVLRVCPVPDEGRFVQAILAVVVGGLTEGDFNKHGMRTHEAAVRLFGHRGESHVTSWRSRDPDDAPERYRFAGAIVAGRVYISFSSELPEQLDEGIAVAIACQTGLLNRSACNTLLQMQDNTEGQVVVARAMETLESATPSPAVSERLV